MKRSSDGEPSEELNRALISGASRANNPSCALTISASSAQNENFAPWRPRGVPSTDVPRIVAQAIVKFHSRLQTRHRIPHQVDVAHHAVFILFGIDLTGRQITRLAYGVLACSSGVKLYCAQTVAERSRHLEAARTFGVGHEVVIAYISRSPPMPA